MVNVDWSFQKQIDHLCVAFSYGVVDRKLVQFILHSWVHSLVKQELHESLSFLLVFDCARFEQGRLQEVGGIVSHGGDVEAVRIDH